MSALAMARFCAVGMVAALFLPAFLIPLTALNHRAVSWTSFIASISCCVLAVAATYRASRSIESRRHGHCALAAGTAFLGGLAYLEATGREPTAIPIAGLWLILIGAVGLILATSTLPSRTL